MTVWEQAPRDREEVEHEVATQLAGAVAQAVRVINSG
jgi:hypothetical protein